MRKLLTSAVALGAAAMIAGCSTLSGDINFTGAVLGEVDNGQLVIANVAYKVNATPRSFEAVVDLQYRKYSTSSWTTEDEKIVRLADLPDAGDSGTTPNVEAFCAHGQWRVRMHVYGVSSGGTPQDVTYYYPGPDSSSSGRTLC